MSASPIDLRSKFPDPYDLWMTDLGVEVRRQFYRGKLSGKLAAVAIAFADWTAPGLSRSLVRSEGIVCPITVAQLILLNPQVDPAEALAVLLDCAVPDRGTYGLAWGLGFPWMSKNGFYSPGIPFITHSPYAMEALLSLSRSTEVADQALESFRDTWPFLETLHVMHDTKSELALSYAPVQEPRIVINANAYAAFAFALHSKYNDRAGLGALERVNRLVNYVISQQREDGSWFYYADSAPGNFIDCFHSCFVLKNLLKIDALGLGVEADIDQAVSRGKAYLDDHFFDEKRGLVQRFTQRDIKDPYVWDLYDQAEYLGLMIDCGDLERAERLHHQVCSDFSDGDNWYCRLDWFGRKWGRNFARWGIVPFHYQAARLKNLKEI